MKNKKITALTIVCCVLLWAGSLAAQVAETAARIAPTDTQVLKVYFFLLVFATIISRIVQYIKLFFQWIWPKVAFLQKISEKLWLMVKKQMDKLGLSYKEGDIKQIVRTVLLAIVLHTIGFIIGIVLCLNFELGVIHLLGWTNIHPTLNYLITGVLIGAGIEPVHSAFRLAEEKRRIKKLKTQISSGQ